MCKGVKKHRLVFTGNSLCCISQCANVNTCFLLAVTSGLPSDVVYVTYQVNDVTKDLTCCLTLCHATVLISSFIPSDIEQSHEFYPPLVRKCCISVVFYSGCLYSTVKAHKGSRALNLAKGRWSCKAAK